MRFKKGIIVEVFGKKEVPSGSWHRAEIISGNGHNYAVRYKYPGHTGEAIVGRVSRKAIRPCPPLVDSVENWVPGDLVEVFDNNSWKMAKVSDVTGGNYIWVRLLGSSQEFRVQKSDLRVRLVWQYDKWVMVGKGAGKCEDGKCTRPLTSKYYQNSNSQLPQTDTRIKEHVTVQESHMVSSKVLKRGSACLSLYHDECEGVPSKTRVIEKEGRRKWAVPEYPTPLPKKVDAVAYPQEMLGEKYMHASFNNRMNGFSEMDMEWEKSNDDGYILARSLEPNGAESSSCSVGSCSSNNSSPYKFLCGSLTDPRQDMDNNLDDAESFCGWGHEQRCSLPSKEDLEKEIHRLELHAYRCTMEALYASGPMSWEQEALVTNLRLSLHISNDEHLMELRNLVSAETNLLIS